MAMASTTPSRMASIMASRSWATARAGFILGIGVVVSHVLFGRRKWCGATSGVTRSRYGALGAPQPVRRPVEVVCFAMQDARRRRATR